MEPAEPLDDLLIDSEDLIGRCLAALGEGELLGGAVVTELQLRYRLTAIARLLGDGDPDAFRDHLHRSACAALYLFERLEEGADLEAKNLTVRVNPGFADAVVAGDLELARRLAELSPQEHVEGHEYEDDFLRYHLLHRMLLGADDDELRALLDRWEEVMEGQTSTPWAMSTALVERDAAALGEGLLDLVEEHDAWFEQFRTNAGYVPEIDATLGKISMNGLVVLRFAELREIPTDAEYRFMPDIARLPVGGPFPPRDAWLTPPA